MVNLAQKRQLRSVVRPSTLPVISRVQGVDYSGAAESGKTAWLATLAPDGPLLDLQALKPLGKLAASATRDRVNQFLRDRILASRQTLWGIDFPFGLPVELKIGTWRDQLAHVCRHVGDAKSYGRSLVDLARKVTGQLHIRRQTDLETKTPFDCYHYRIIYQTFHGMRDVLEPISTDPRTAVLPFDYDRASKDTDRLVVEACPSSFLKRNGLPHQRYKQSGGKEPTEAHRQTRREILRAIRGRVRISAYRRRVILSDSGGDALDAVLAGLGAWEAIRRVNHEQIAADQRYSQEGYVYC